MTQVSRAGLLLFGPQPTRAIDCPDSPLQRCILHWVPDKKTNWAIGGAYQSSGIGAVEAEEGDGSLDLLARGGCSEGADLAGNGALRSSRPRGAEHSLSREHGDGGIGCGDGDLECL